MISEMFRLEICWASVKYERTGVAQLYGCYFSGPVISEIVGMREQDEINLDFVKQYPIIVNYFYIAKFKWCGIRMTVEKIFLDNVTLENKNMNVVPKLKKDDYIVVDTSGHQPETHYQNLTYPAYLLNKDGVLYNFGGRNA